MKHWRFFSGVHLQVSRVSIVRELLRNMAVGGRAVRLEARSGWISVIGEASRGSINIRRVR